MRRARPATEAQHRSAVNRALPSLGKRRIDAITPQDVADLVAKLHADGKKRETVRKTVTALAMVFDHAGLTGPANPARDRLTVKLPREEPEEISPPTAAQLEVV